MADGSLQNGRLDIAEFVSPAWGGLGILLSLFSVASQAMLFFVFLAAMVLKMCERKSECQRLLGMDDAFQASVAVLFASVPPSI